MCERDGMRRLVAALIAVAMATTGCATYAGARRSRNVGIGIGVVAAAMIAGGLSIDDDKLARDSFVICGTLLIPYALGFALVGVVGMGQHDPERERGEQEREQQERVERERSERAQQEGDEQAHEREQAKIERRDYARALVKRAVEAARDGRCVDAIALEGQIRDLDADVHATWFVSDPDILRCMSWSPPPAHESP